MDDRSRSAPDLPTGTVTFLFTDIEGSTRLLRQLGDRYQQVLADHHRLLRGTLEQAGGTLVDTVGDGLFFAFRRARDATRGAAEAQRALAQHEWPDDAEVRVRMGIHTGEAIVTEVGYVGMALHRAARTSSAAHGGQILVSHATAAVLEDEDLSGVTLRDLGEQRLKDFDKPVCLYQVLAPGLPADFLPPRTAESNRQPEPSAAAPSKPWAGPHGADAPISVVIADDQRLLRSGFRAILDSESDIDVVGEAVNGHGAVALVESLRPAVVLMDIRMPELDGLTAAEQLLGNPDLTTSVVMLTTFDGGEYVYRALRAGVSGYLLKDAPPERLIEAVRVAAGGEALIAPEITRRIIAEFAHPSAPPEDQRSSALASLSEPELESLRLVARGQSNAEIATSLGLGEDTVRDTIDSISAKLELRDRAQAVVIAYECGLVERERR